MGECGCSGATRSLPHFGCPGVWGGGRSICFRFSPPEWLGTGFETPQMHWTLVDLQAVAGPQTQSSVSITPRQSSLHTAGQGCPDLWPPWWQSRPKKHTNIHFIKHVVETRVTVAQLYLSDNVIVYPIKTSLGLGTRLYLLCDAYPSVGINISSLQFGFHSLPHADCVGVPLLYSCKATANNFTFQYISSFSHAFSLFINIERWLF